jgi:hypothetical protein
MYVPLELVDCMLAAVINAPLASFLSVHSQSACAICGGVLITVPFLQGQLHVLLQPF